MVEVFRDIKDYEGYYQVSNWGRVKSCFRKVKRGKYWSDKKETIMKPSNDTKGYAKTSLTVNGNAYTYRVHKLIANAFIENPLNKLCINHKDGNVGNNDISNLEWATYSENTIHAIKHGLIKSVIAPHGSKSHLSKLDEQQVIEIKKELKKGTSHRLLGIKHGVTRGAITCININKSWKHVTI